MVDTSVLFTALKDPRIMKTIERFSKPCISELVESELEHLVLMKGMNLSRFLVVWARTRTVRCKRIKDHHRKFLEALPEDLQATFASHPQDSLIGYAAYKHGITTIITNNTRDFTVWERFNVRVLTYHEFVNEHVGGFRIPRATMAHESRHGEGCLA